MIVGILLLCIVLLLASTLDEPVPQKHKDSD
jgi:hypothetical protein